MTSTEQAKAPIRQRLLQSYPGLAKYFVNTSWMMAERVLRMVVALLVGIYVARYLGPERLGLLSYAVAFVGLFGAIATVGLDSIVVRDLVKAPEKRDELLGTAFFLKIIGAICMWGAIVVGVQFTNNDSFLNMLIAIIAAGVLLQAFNVIEFNFQAAVQSKYVVQVQVIQMLISSIVKLTLIWIEAPLLWFAIVSLSDAIVLATGLVWNYLRKGGHLSVWKFRKVTAAKLLKDSWPLILAGMAVMAYMRIDQVMIKEMLNAHSVGEYAVAVRLAEVWYFIPTIVCASLFPAIVHAKDSDEALYQRRLQQLYDLMVCIALPIALSIAFFANYLVVFLFGAPFSEAGPVLSIYIWASIAVFLGIASSQYLTADNLLLFSFFRTFFGVLLNIVLNLVLIPKYGINGAAIATLVSYSVATFSLVVFERTRAQGILMFKSLFLVSFITRIRRLYAA